jgi:hypothetical protein
VVTSVDAKLISSLDTERFGTCLVRIQQVNFQTVERCIGFFGAKVDRRTGSAHQSFSGFFLFTVTLDR